jgi:hypothetical protein
MYITEIIWLISWPLFIWVSYKLSELAIKNFKKFE